MLTKICVVGLGYVGLPLAIEFSQYFPIIGFDVNQERINQLKQNFDKSGEMEESKLTQSQVQFTSNPERIKEANFIIICVPTPVNNVKQPDFFFLESASEVVGKNLSENSIVVYESTVYPGCTEEVCVPILEKYSGFKCGQQFKIGYSPERINPGDKEHCLSKVIKIVSGMDGETLDKVASVYSYVAKAGVHKAPNIKTAEAAKVIENIQRDLNIALINELDIIFDRIGIKTKDVLNAAGTKWNWHKYHPGLVGGHCISVDPYYLTYKAEELGYHPEVILAGRRINDNMHKFYVEKIIKKYSHLLSNHKILILGLTFKPNVSDYRNSGVKLLIKELHDYHIQVSAYDPYLSKEIVENHFHAQHWDPSLNLSEFDLVLLAVEHHKLLNLLDVGVFSNKPILYLSEL